MKGLRKKYLFVYYYTKYFILPVRGKGNNYLPYLWIRLQSEMFFCKEDELTSVKGI